MVSACLAAFLSIGAATGEDLVPRFRKERPVLRPFLPPPGETEYTEQIRPPISPAQFNPDPGQSSRPSIPLPTPVPSDSPPSSGFRLLAPDYDLLFPEEALPMLSGYGAEPLDGDLKLPRRDVLERVKIRKEWHQPEYPLGREGLGLLPHSRAVPSRWLLTFPHWKRYHDPSIETPYSYETPRLWHPYEQSTLKADLPILGEDIFLNLTAKNFTLTEFRKLPVPSGVSAAVPNSSEFFGRGQQVFISNDTSFTVELFKGETVFKPVHWALRVTGVYNNNWIWVKENGLLDPDPRGPDFPEEKGAPNTGRIQAIGPDGSSVNPRSGRPKPFTSVVNPGDVFNYLAPQLKPIGDAEALLEVDPVTNEPGPNERKGKGRSRDNDFDGTRYTRRHKDHFALQEAFAEIHFSDLSENFDFISSRTGIQPFVSDFRGFIFADTNLGVRVFGNLDNNRLQYNLAAFNMREKDTYSDLNTLESRNQRVVIANAYRQDFLWKGYTAQLSFHANFDDGGTHYDKNGFLTRPALLGTVRDEGDFFGSDGGLRTRDVRAYYLGWTGDGHIGRLNITHAFYQVLGEDEYNGLAGRRVGINAQMAALELSYDRDWIRFKLSGFYASGDSDPTDDEARGFDTILDNPFFIGGPFSWYVHQGINLAGTAVNLKQRDSLVPNLRSSKTEGQSNFVNPGVMILGAGTDVELTPKLRGFLNCNYIWLAETKTIEVGLQSNKIRNELGLDASVGFKFRPLLTDNIIVAAGVGFFVPGAGYRDIYRRSTQRVPGFGPQDQEGKVDDFLYNGFLTVTFVY